MKHATDAVYGAGKRDADSHSSEEHKLRPKEQASYPHYPSRPMPEERAEGTKHRDKNAIEPDARKDGEEAAGRHGRK